MIKLRKANVKDLEVIDKIYSAGRLDEEKLTKKERETKKKNFDGKKKDRIKELRKDLSSKKDFWLVAEDGNKIIAFGQALKLNKEVGSIEKIYVRKDYRRKGIGKKLLRELIKNLKKQKAERVVAYIRPENTASRELHESLGFNVPTIRMEKSLR